MADRAIAIAFAMAAVVLVLSVALLMSRGPSPLDMAVQLVRNQSATLVYKAVFNQTQQVVIEYSFNASARKLFISQRAIPPQGSPNVELSNVSNTSIWVNGTRLCIALITDIGKNKIRYAYCSEPSDLFYSFMPLGSLVLGNWTYAGDGYYVNEVVHISRLGQRQVLGQTAQCYLIALERAQRQPQSIAVRINTTETLCLSPDGIPLAFNLTSLQLVETPRRLAVSYSLNATLVSYKLGYFDEEAFNKTISEAQGG